MEAYKILSISPQPQQMKKRWRDHQFRPSRLNTFKATEQKKEHVLFLLFQGNIHFALFMLLLVKRLIMNHFH